jgi:hypothetical protein
LPASLLGAMAGLAALLVGAAWRWHTGVLEVTLFPGAASPARRAQWSSFSAITFGHVVLALTDEDQTSLRAHERVHVAQYERWGVFFLLAYPAESLLQLLLGRRPYFDNRFEVAARAGASRGAPPPPDA